jgi:Putative transmembrane protein (PGPGW)
VDISVTLSELIGERHHRHVVSRAKPHLGDDEAVVSWTRARHPRRGHGFVFLTNSRLLVVWSGQADGHRAVALQDIDAWGVDSDAAGGPLLAVESSDNPVLVHMPVRSQGGESRVSNFVHKLARAAPRPRRRVRVAGNPTAFESDPHRLSITRRKLSPMQLTKRIVITAAGIVLVVAGAVITPIPGPWSLPLLLAGLAVLASEYDWARDVLDWAKETSRRARERLRARRAAP